MKVQLQREVDLIGPRDNDVAVSQADAGSDLDTPTGSTQKQSLGYCC